MLWSLGQFDNGLDPLFKSLIVIDICEKTSNHIFSEALTKETYFQIPRRPCHNSITFQIFDLYL